MLGEYLWRGYKWQIAEEDVDKYPGAVPVNRPAKKKKAPAKSNKSRRAPKNK